MRYRHASEKRKEIEDEVSPELAFCRYPEPNANEKPPADVYYTQCTYERERQVSRDAESKMTKYPEDQSPLNELEKYPPT